MACCDIPRGRGRGRPLTANMGLLDPRSAAAVNAVRVHGVGRRRPRGQPRPWVSPARASSPSSDFVHGRGRTRCGVDIKRTALHWKAIVVSSPDVIHRHTRTETDDWLHYVHGSCCCRLACSVNSVLQTRFQPSRVVIYWHLTRCSTIKAIDYSNSVYGVFSSRCVFIILSCTSRLAILQRQCM